MYKRSLYFIYFMCFIVKLDSQDEDRYPQTIIDRDQYN